MSFSWFRLSYAYFIIAAVLGSVMRLHLAGYSFAPYENLLHSHSHIAFLGWVYSSLFLLLIHSFLDTDKIKKYRFMTQLKITHIVLLSVLAAFLLQGYGVYSILLSSGFQLMTYWYIFSFMKALKAERAVNSVAEVFLKIALWSLFISSIGPWALPVVKMLQLSSAIYNGTIYFYMHFLFNGWILFALLALFFRSLEKDKKDLANSSDARRFLLYMAYALPPGYFISILGIFKTPWSYSLAALSALLQLQALFFFIRLLFSIRKMSGETGNDLSWPLKVLYLVVITSFSTKIILQIMLIVPELAELALNSRGIIMAYLHLIMLGIISSYLLSIFIRNKILIMDSLPVKISLLLFMACFIAIEIFLGFQFSAIELFYNPGNLALLTSALAVSIILISYGFKKGILHGN